MAEGQQDGEAFPKTIHVPSSSESLDLLGHGTTDVTIETIHVIFTKIGVYFEPAIKDHIQSFKGKPVSELLKEGSGFFKQLIEAPVAKLVKVLLVKAQLGRQYASTIETNIRDKLAYDDKYEEEEEEALEKLCEFFRSKTLKPNSSIVYKWPRNNTHVEVTVYNPDDTVQDSSYTVNNKNIASAILDWIVGENSMTPTTTKSVAETCTTV